jgi:hypothetical protein
MAALTMLLCNFSYIGFLPHAILVHLTFFLLFYPSRVYQRAAHVQFAARETRCSSKGKIGIS